MSFLPESGKQRILAEPLLSPTLLLRAVRTKGTDGWPAGVRLFSYGRYALATYIRERGVGNRTLYVPSYICSDAVTPPSSLGQQIRYYPVTEGLEPEWDWLGSQIEGSGNMLLLVHYFGFPNAIDRALEFCRSHDMTLIEDCAHSFLSRYGGKCIGTFGEAGFYSYRKILPIPDGAGLVDNGAHHVSLSSHNGPQFRPTHWRPIARRLLRFGIDRSGSDPYVRSLRRFASKNSEGAISKLRGSSRNGSALPTQVVRRRRHTDENISRISYQLMKALEPEFESIFARRQRNYRYLLDAFASFPEVHIIYPDLEDGTCPYVFPVLLTDRARVIGRLRAEGVPAHRWPELPPEIVGSQEFPMANRFADQVMMLPIHQGLSNSHLQQVVDAYRKVRAE